MVGIGLRWFLGNDGLAASSHLEAGGFIRSAAGRAPPRHPVPLPAGAGRGPRPLEGRHHAFQAHVGTMRPLSRGWLALRSRRSAPAPDHRAQLPGRGARPGRVARLRRPLTREIFEQSAFDRYRGRELARRRGDGTTPRSTPSSGARPTAPIIPAAPAAWASTRKRWSTRSAGCAAWRPCGSSTPRSCRASSPAISNAPTIMLAEKAADLILGRPPPPASGAGLGAPDWRTRQRPGAPAEALARGPLESTLSV